MDANSSTAVLFDFGGTLDADGLAWKERVYRLFRDEGVAVERERFDPLFHPAADPLVGDSPSADMAGAGAVGMRHIWLVSATAPAQDPCCRGDRVIHSLKDLEALLQ